MDILINIIHFLIKMDGELIETTFLVNNKLLFNAVREYY